MKLVVKIDDRKCLLDAPQVEALVNALHGCEYYHEDYVGPDKGTMGHNNSYTPMVRPLNVEEWFTAKIMRQDLIDTIKLRMKLDKKETS